MLRAFSLTTLGILLVYGQVGVWGGWGGHTSVNDLTAAGEVWNRFYAVYSVGVRFLPERRVQPLIGWQGGSFISQNRELGQYARTSWNAIGLGLRAHCEKACGRPFSRSVPTASLLVCGTRTANRLMARLPALAW